ncbi:MAG: ABC transporter substrate-binding protein [Hyphomicrobiales bacterium]
MRVLTVLIFLLVGSSPLLANDKLYPSGSESTSDTLTIYSSLDISAAEPLIMDFQRTNADVSIHYYEMQTIEIYERVLRETEDDVSTADLIISSAMDLQMKLANDGYAQALSLPGAPDWPNWASWRDTAFALTYEPSVFVYHKPSFEGRKVPKTRAALQALLNEPSDPFYGRVATYDIERAGVGFLFLARDAEHARDIWSLVKAMGAAGVKLYSSSSAILERVSDGRFAIGYNILGSYAKSWVRNHPDLGIILPSDFTVVMSRIALVPEAAARPRLGVRFLEYLMSEAGQRILATKSGIPALHPNVTGENTASALRLESGAQLRPISVSPGLLVYLDQVKRARFVQKWNKALREK